MFGLVGELVTFNPSMGFNVTALGQKITVYEDTVGLDVTSNKATGVKQGWPKVVLIVPLHELIWAPNNNCVQTMKTMITMNSYHFIM